MSATMANQRFRLVHDDENGGWTAYDGDTVMFTAREHNGAEETIRLFVDRVENQLPNCTLVVLLDVTEYGYDALFVPWEVVNP